MKKIHLKCSTAVGSFVAILLLFGSFACSQLKDSDNPFAATSTDYQRWGPRLPDDAIMPTPDLIQRVDRWSRMAFAGDQMSDDAETFSLQLIRQDFSTLKFNQSVLATPLKIGSRSFDKGLGTHSNSEIRVTFPEPVTKFTAFVGIDNNADTGGSRGSVQFAVVVDGKELVRTRTLRGSNEATEIDLTLPAKTTVLTLIVDGTADGPSHDQADWCEPVAVGVSGTIYHLSDASVRDVALLHMNTALPFSFQYGGVHSSELLPHWKFECKDIDRNNRVYSWTDPKTGLKVSAKLRQFERFAGVDWVLYFENTGTQNTPLIENVRTLDMNVTIRGGKNQPNIINSLIADNHGPSGWTPTKYTLRNGGSRRIVPVGGKSSNGQFPFWNIQCHETGDNEESSGMFVAIGWSGQWSANFSKTDDDVNVNVGMDKISTTLYPGESIRQPRALIMPWNSSRINAQVLFRRLMMFEYAPKPKYDLPVQLPVAGQSFDRYWWNHDLPSAQRYQGWGGHEWGTYEGQVAWAKILHKAGFTHQWLDAAWFQEGWWRGTGNWFADTIRFPQGIGALGKAIHQLGMKFILWIEPERSLLSARMFKEHPDYFFPSLGHRFFSEETTLFKLNDPEARKFLTDFLRNWIITNNVDVLRIDFNIDPISYWNATDAANRRGITEVNYVAGLYEKWGQLIKDIPGLWIDNCASGGRRIDLETTALSVPLWSSDAGCHPETPVEWQHTTTMGMAQYLPVFSCAAWESDPYSFRSNASMGTVASFNFMDSDYDAQRAKAAAAEAKVYQKFWYGDFYPLTEVRLGDEHLLAWQLHREDLSAGIVYVFRQKNCLYSGYELSLHAIDGNATYEVTLKRDYSKGTTKRLSGEQLISIQADMPQKQSSLVIEYRKIN